MTKSARSTSAGRVHGTEAERLIPPMDTIIGYKLRRAQLYVFQDFIASFAKLKLRPAEFSVLTLIAAKLMLASVPAEEIQPWEQVWANAWAGLPIQIASLALFAVAVTWIGSLFGGTGRFSDALLAVTWVQGVMLVPQAVQILIFPVLPGVSGLIALGSVVLFFYLLSQFICVVHGFRSAVAVFFVVIGTLLALGIVLAVLFTMLGVLPVGPEA